MAQHLTPRDRGVVFAHEDNAEVKNVVQWGPIIAGVATAIAVMLVLTVLGLALGAAAFEPRDPGDNVGTWAAIWGAITILVALFIGGHVAAYSASVPGKGSGLLNGFLVGAAALLLVIYLTVSGIGNLFGAIGNNLGDIANIAQDQAQEEGVTTVEDVEGVVADATQDIDADQVSNAFDVARDAAWGTLGGILLALGAATAGGLTGSNSRRDLAERSADPTSTEPTA
jgi:hypothetical protein